MSFQDVAGGLSFLGLIGVIVFAFWDMSDPQKSGPVKERDQMVFEAQCDSGSQVFYQPVNTIGIVFDSKGRTVSKLPDCTVVHIGKVEEIGQIPLSE